MAVEQLALEKPFLGWEGPAASLLPSPRLICSPAQLEPKADKAGNFKAQFASPGQEGFLGRKIYFSQAESILWDPWNTGFQKREGKND